MNVKTAHRDFPKEQLLDVVVEINGKTDEAHAARQQRRGAKAAYVREYKVGAQRVNLLAAEHNKK
eukprot:3767892-Pleurochrysis_carterae.AAC.1